jgi:hypothetical protein
MRENLEKRGIYVTMKKKVAKMKNMFFMNLINQKK